MDKDFDQQAKVKTLGKAIKILECFSIEEPELGITQISNKLGIYKSSVHNIITTLESYGYIEKNLSNDKYRLGLKMLQFSYIISNQIGFRYSVHPYLQEIAKEFSESCYFAIPNDLSVLYLDAAYPMGMVAFRTVVGDRAPLYCTGIGKAMLAYMDDKAIETVKARGFEKFTENTICSEEEYHRELSTIKQQGYSIDNMEHEYGVKCVGVPIFSHDGSVCGGLSVTGPSLRFDSKRIEQIARVLIDSSRKLQGVLTIN